MIDIDAWFDEKAGEELLKEGYRDSGITKERVAERRQRIEARMIEWLYYHSEKELA